MNQMDLVAEMPMTEAERLVVARIVAGRKNLLDRFNLQAP